MSKSAAILSCLGEYPHAYPLTTREIVGLKSSSTVHRYLVRLAEQGLIKRKPNCRRCISVVRHG